MVTTLVNILGIGSLYALVALGYTLVYGVLRFINFAHSDVFTFGAWASLTIAGSLGWAKTGSPAFALPVVLVATMAICAALGVLLETLAYRPLRRAPRLNVLITAIGVSLFLQNAGQLASVFGPNPRVYPRLIDNPALFSLGNTPVRLVDIFIVGLAIVLMLGLEAMVYRTKLGMAMRAVSFDERVASLLGINVNRIVSITFAVGSALAAAGGVLFALKYGNVKPTADSEWVVLGMKAFVAAVVGGIGNIRGAVAGAMLIATVEIVGWTYLWPGFRDVYVFATLIIVLLVRPAGLFGKAVLEKV